HVDALTSGLTALHVMALWTVPVLALTFAGVSLGVGIAWLWFLLTGQTQRKRTATGTRSAWRDMTLSMGDLERPRWSGLPRDELVLDIEDDLADRYAKMSAPQQRLFAEVLGVINAHPGAFVGDGHKGKLIDHTIHVLSRLPADCADPLLPIAAAAHDCGKILAWKRVGTDDNHQPVWERVGWHDDLGGLMLSALPAMSELPENERRILVNGLRFAHKSGKRPTLPNRTDTTRMKTVMDAVTGADHTATAAEKVQVLQEMDREPLLEKVFMEALSDLPVHRPGLKVEGIAWRKQQRIYISDPKLREFLLPRVARYSASATAAWNVQRKGGEMVQMTKDLLALFAEKGWLVTKIDDKRANPPLWNIRSGKVDIKGVIALDLPLDVINANLSMVQTHFPIKVVGPLFEAGVGRDGSKQEKAQLTRRSESRGTRSAREKYEQDLRKSETIPDKTEKEVSPGNSQPKRQNPKRDEHEPRKASSSQIAEVARRRRQ
ncbi:MAG: hypothetical protein L0H29_04670, partial [Sinobacteraceae bacterium]|nr:hypothetical protein [Nevskiaceae bacterium]